jgi:hypothetical protein
MFLGNPATTIETIRNTLRTANREGLANLFDSCGLNTHIRVFDYEEPTGATLDATYSAGFDLQRTSYQQLLPSFAYPPALLRDFCRKSTSRRGIGKALSSRRLLPRPSRVGWRSF